MNVVDAEEGLVDVARFAFTVALVGSVGGDGDVPRFG